jgi:hypothetical protein
VRLIADFHPPPAARGRSKRRFFSIELANYGQYDGFFPCGIENLYFMAPAQAAQAADEQLGSGK